MTSDVEAASQPPLHLLSVREWERAVGAFRLLMRSSRVALLQAGHAVPLRHLAGDDAFVASEEVIALAGRVAASGDARSEVLMLGRERIRVLIVPLFSDARRWLLVLQLHEVDAGAVNVAAARLAQATPIIDELRALAEAHRAGQEIEARRHALDALSRVQQHTRFDAAAIELCNTVNARLRADRTGLALIRGWHARLIAVSDAERIVRHTTLVQRLESVCEECADQGEAIFEPPVEMVESAPVVLATRRLAALVEADAVAALPLRDAAGEIFATLVCTRAGSAWESAEVASLQHTARQVGPTLRRIEVDGRSTLRRLLERLGDLIIHRGPGRSHPWLRLAACLASVLLIASLLLRTDHVVRAPAAIVFTQASSVAAPWQGVLETVEVAPADHVRQGDPLAHLETRRLDLEIEALAAEVSALQRRADAARLGAAPAEVRLATLEADQARVRLEAARRERDRARIVAPATGVVVEGDWLERAGQVAPEGVTLFTIGHEGTRRVRLHVREGDIHLIAAGDTAVATVHVNGFHDLRGVVEHIDDRATLVGGVNGFAVDVRLDQPPTWLLPGLTGWGKVVVGRRTWFDAATDVLGPPLREWLFRAW